MSLRIVILAALAMLCFPPLAHAAADSNAGPADGFYLVLDDPADRTADAVVVANYDQPDSPLKLDRKILVSAKEIARASVARHHVFGTPVIIVELTAAGGAQMHAVTTKYLHHRIAIVVGGVIISAPMIMSPIDEHFQIEGNFELARAKAIADRLTRH